MINQSSFCLNRQVSQTNTNMLIPTLSSSPVSIFHILSVASRLPDTTVDSWMCMHLTVDVCPYKVWMHCPVSAFHTLRVLSVDPDMTMCSFICEDHTPPVWPINVRRHFPVSADQTLDEWAVKS